MNVISSSEGNYVSINGRRYSYFGGNNYLGLAQHPLLKEAAAESITRYGLSFSASRVTSGTSEIHIELEKKLSEFKCKQDTVVFPSGYQGNSILLQVLKGSKPAVFIDQYAHPSIMENIPQDIVYIKHYKHCDSDHLESLLKHLPKGYEPRILTDGIFALTGEISPLDKIAPIADRYNAILIVDDAHSTGILGENGRGTPEYFHLGGNDNIYQTETMSKSFGSYGGFISGSKGLISSIRGESSVYQASTALPPPLVAAGIASLNIIKAQPELRIHLLEKSFTLREKIINLGYQSSGFGTPIIPLLFSHLEYAQHLSEYLKNSGIIVPCINYPVKLSKYLVRIAVSVKHTDEQTADLLKLLKQWKTTYGPILKYG